MPAAEICTGFRISTPAFLKSGMNSVIAPQVWKKVFHGVCPVDPVVHLPVQRHEHLAVCLGGDERAALGAEVRAAHHDDIDPVPHGLPVRLEVLHPDLALVAEDIHHVLLAGNRGHVPFLGIPDSLRMQHGRAGHLRDVPEARAPEVAHEGVLAVLEPVLRCLLQEAQLLLGVRGAVLLGPLAGVQRRLVDRLLAHDAVEVEAVLRHSSRGRSRAITLRVLHDVPAGKNVVLEVSRDLHLRAVEHREPLPVLVSISEDGRGELDAEGVHAEGLLHGVLDLREHLEGIIHPHDPSRDPQGLLEPRVGARRDPRDQGASKVEGDPVGLFMVDRLLHALS